MQGQAGADRGGALRGGTADEGGRTAKTGGACGTPRWHLGATSITDFRSLLTIKKFPVELQGSVKNLVFSVREKGQIWEGNAGSQMGSGRDR